MSKFDLPELLPIVVFKQGFSKGRSAYTTNNRSETYNTIEVVAGNQGAILVPVPGQAQVVSFIPMTFRLCQSLTYLVLNFIPL